MLLATCPFRSYMAPMQSLAKTAPKNGKHKYSARTTPGSLPQVGDHLCRWSPDRMSLYTYEAGEPKFTTGARQQEECATVGVIWESWRRRPACRFPPPPSRRPDFSNARSSAPCGPPICLLAVKEACSRTLPSQFPAETGHSRVAARLILLLSASSHCTALPEVDKKHFCSTT